MPKLSLLALLLSSTVALADGPTTGPATEKRFPPLKVPAGFKATLFACDPFIEYPSVICIGPRNRSLFVAIDYMTGLGTEIIRRDEIRLIDDKDGDGYAESATVYADSFNSIQGIAYHPGSGHVFVMHAPLLTRLRDTDGDGKADERQDIVTGLGLPPEQNPPRLHCANGVTIGHDGWLYLSLGDHGCDVKRPEGDKLVLHGGGILRCRSDGSGLHVFASGLRNIYDVALDDELNVFVRDNENDGGTYMIRQAHSFHGADHGYPYLYYERPGEALKPLADLGLGSSAGGACYLEPAFPKEYRGNLFWCEWGRCVMRSPLQRAGSSFAPVKEIEFAAGAPNDPYGFKPTDVVVGYEGALYVSDWCDGQRPKRGRGRIYRIAAEGAVDPTLADRRKQSPKDWIVDLDSPSYLRRFLAHDALERLEQGEGLDWVKKARAAGRLGTHGWLHSIWIQAHLQGPDAIEELLALARKEGDVTIRCQAVRALADLADPSLADSKAPRDVAKIARSLADIPPADDARLTREIVIALGRLRWEASPQWLKQHVKSADSALAHAAQQTLRRSGNWAPILELLDEPDTQIRTLALYALADQHEPAVAKGLIARLAKEKDAVRRLEYGDWLTRIYKAPGAWTYWGYRPPPRPAATANWLMTDKIAAALNTALADPTLRFPLLKRMQREKVPVRVSALSKWLQDDHDREHVATLLDVVRAEATEEARPVLAAIVKDAKHDVANRLTALTAWNAGLKEDADLLALAKALEAGPVLAEAMTLLGTRPKASAEAFLVRHALDDDPLVRAAAMTALVELGAREAKPLVEKFLSDRDARALRAAVMAVGKLKMRDSAATLLNLATQGDLALKSACLDSLRQLEDRRGVALAVASLKRTETESAALALLKELGGPEQVKEVADVARRHPALETQRAVLSILERWATPPGSRRDVLEQIAAVHGSTGMLLQWRVVGPVSAEQAAKLRKGDVDASAKFALGDGADGRVTLAKEPGLWLAVSDVRVDESAKVQFLAASNSAYQVWLDDRSLFERVQPKTYQADADRVDVELTKGTHRVALELRTKEDAAQFHLRFRKKSANDDHEKLAQLALSRPGSPERGKTLFRDVQKSQCLKCHQMEGQGEKIGPDLTGVGKRFAKVFLVESLLDPSRSVGPNFETTVVEMKDGRVVTGLHLEELAQTLTLADNEGKKHTLPIADIDTRRVLAKSIMPEGLERRFTPEEFVDLIAYLASRK